MLEGLIPCIWSSSLGDKATKWTRRLLTDPSYAWLLASLVVLGDALLTQLIIRFVRYTEIDWETYMQHIDLYRAGERNYTAITGPTGPLVYPAGHVYIHDSLYKLTSSGLNISLAQQIYGALYLISLALTCTIYVKAGGVPNWVLLMLPLSKRLHSIYSLRLFNDCWAVVGAQGAMLALAEGYYTMACILFSLAISVKMSVLLYMPGLLMILWQQRGVAQTILHVATIALFQLILGWQFLSEYPWEYLSGAFDLSRVFLFKWTVNWRFLGEDLFLNSAWAKYLLLGHLCMLALFAHFKWSGRESGFYKSLSKILQSLWMPSQRLSTDSVTAMIMTSDFATAMSTFFDWCGKDGGLFHLLTKTLRAPWVPYRPLSVDSMMTILMTSNLIGIVFARSLHYQFYSWYAQQIPFLAWRTRYPLIMKLAIIASIEYAWNVFPSTVLSSTVLVSSNILLLLGVWYGWPDGRDNRHRTARKLE